MAYNDDYIPPVAHSRLGRAGHTLGNAATTGFEGGMIGAAIGYMTLPTLAAWAIGYIAVATGLVGSLVAWPAVVTLIGASAIVPMNLPLAAVGAGLVAPVAAWFGGKTAHRITGEEMAAAEYDRAFSARMNQLEGQFAQQQAQQAQMLQAALAQQYGQMAQPPMSAPMPAEYQQASAPVAPQPEAPACEPAKHEHIHTHRHEKTETVADAKVNHLKETQSDIRVKTEEKKPVMVKTDEKPGTKLDAKNIDFSAHATLTPTVHDAALGTA